MSIFGKLDLADGELPPWLNQFVSIARPLFTAGIVAIPCVGAFVVGTVAAIHFETAKNMVAASTTFLQGIPDAAYGAIVAVALGYSASKTVEAIKMPPPPAGAPPPEQPAVDAARRRLEEELPAPRLDWEEERRPRTRPLAPPPHELDPENLPAPTRPSR